MFRRAFRKTGVRLDQDSAHLAVPPLLLGKGRGTLLLAFLLSAHIAAGSLITNPVSTNNDFRTLSLVMEIIPMEGQEIQPRPELLLASFASSSMDKIQNINGGPTDTSTQTYEAYPYLLLTAGLILLAFRPANPGMAGRP